MGNPWQRLDGGENVVYQKKTNKTIHLAFGLRSTGKYLGDFVCHDGENYLRMIEDDKRLTPVKLSQRQSFPVLSSRITDEKTVEEKVK